HFGILIPLALAGVFVTWSERSRLGIYYGLLVAYSASVLLFYVFARYRYPLVPMLVLFAAPAVAAAIGKIPGARVRWPQLAAVAVVAIFVNWPLESANAMRAVTET